MLRMFRNGLKLHVGLLGLQLIHANMIDEAQHPLSLTMTFLLQCQAEWIS